MTSNATMILIRDNILLKKSAINTWSLITQNTLEEPKSAECISLILGANDIDNMYILY